MHSVTGRGPRRLETGHSSSTRRTVGQQVPGQNAPGDGSGSRSEGATKRGGPGAVDGLPLSPHLGTGVAQAPQG
jgi:hypothetical protein